MNANTNYARIDGTSVWIEFVCQSGVVFRNQIHYHSVYRDHTRDYGADLSLTTALDLSPTAAGSQIGGRVLSNLYRSVSGSTVTLTNSQGEVRTTRTNPFGYFAFEGVPSGETYIVSINSKRYTYISQAIHLTEDLTYLTFVGQSLFGSK